jgi:hypothetical protein
MEVGGTAPIEVLPVCCIKQCKHKESTAQLRPCAGQRYKCVKFIHSFCYSAIFIRKHALPTLSNKEEGITHVACSKRCHKKVLTALATGAHPVDATVVRVAWKKDGKLGPDDINNSMNILLEWITENGGENYSKFRGKNAMGMTKLNFAEIIACKISARGVVNPRTPKHVLNKIAHLESTFRVAHDWATGETGAGLRRVVSHFRRSGFRKCTLYQRQLGNRGFFFGFGR